MKTVDKIILPYNLTKRFCKQQSKAIHQAGKYNVKNILFNGTYDERFFDALASLGLGLVTD